jgi:hypothetical protein
MGRHHAQVTPDEAAHPLTRCIHCGASHTDDNQLKRVSVKTCEVDDYHFECVGCCRE